MTEPMTRADGIEQLITGLTMDNGLGPAMDYEEAMPALLALGVSVAEVDDACDQMHEHVQSWRDWGKHWMRHRAILVVDAQP